MVDVDEVDAGSAHADARRPRTGGPGIVRLVAQDLGASDLVDDDGVRHGATSSAAMARAGEPPPGPA